MKLSVLSFNVHKGIGWVSGKSTLASIREQVKELQPDLLFLQEVCGSQFEFLAEEIFPYYSYGKNAIYKTGHHGNAVLSKYPIVFSKNTDISIGLYERRGLLHCIVHVPFTIHPVHLLCVHLGLLRKYRHKQLDKISDYIEQNIPAHEPLIVGGDFNDWRSHASIHMTKRLGLQECFLSQKGAHAKTFPAWIPILKLDRIYSRGFEVCDAQRLVKRHWKRLSDHVAINVDLKYLLSD